MLQILPSSAEGYLFSISDELLKKFVTKYRNLATVRECVSWKSSKSSDKVACPMSVTGILQALTSCQYLPGGDRDNTADNWITSSLDERPFKIKFWMKMKGRINMALGINENEKAYGMSPFLVCAPDDSWYEEWMVDAESCLVRRWLVG